MVCLHCERIVCGGAAHVVVVERSRRSRDWRTD